MSDARGERWRTLWPRQRDVAAWWAERKDSIDSPSWRGTGAHGPQGLRRSTRGRDISGPVADGTDRRPAMSGAARGGSQILGRPTGQDFMPSRLAINRNKNGSDHRAEAQMFCLCGVPCGRRLKTAILFNAVRDLWRIDSPSRTLKKSNFIFVNQLFTLQGASTLYSNKYSEIVPPYVYLPRIKASVASHKTRPSSHDFPISPSLEIEYDTQHACH